MCKFDGLPKSTYYYRKKHPKKTTFAEIAVKFGVTRQNIFNFSKRWGITDLTILENKYREMRGKVKKTKKAIDEPLYAEFEVMGSEFCKKGYIRPQRQTRKDRFNNLIRLFKDEKKDNI